MGDEERGFTLIELMVVVLVIAILLAVAIPTFLGARERANDRAAQSNLRNALTNQLTFYADDQQFTQDPAELSGLDSSQLYAVPPASVPPSGTGIYVEVINTFQPGDTVLLGARTPDGTCFWIRNVGDKNLPRFAENACFGDPTVLPFGDAW
jgi:type IV pilus assembly protein PilA